MNEIEIVQKGGAGRWKFRQREIRMGREPLCDVVLASSTYTMVSRQHAVLRWEEDGLWVEDLKTMNGTFLNGNRVQRAKLSPESVVRLGPDGPELEVRLLGNEPLASTMLPETRPAAICERIEKASVQEAAAARAAVPPQERNSEMGDPMLEGKINTLRTMNAILLVGLIILGGMCVGLSQKVQKNQEALEQMRTEARDSVARVRPDVDARLRRLDEVEAEVRGLDAKMQQAEDRMMQRLETELPRILDRFVERKMRELQNQQMPRR